MKKSSRYSRAKKGSAVTNLLISLLIFSGAVIGFSSFASDLHENNGESFTDVSYLSVKDRIDNTTTSIENKIRGAETSVTGQVDLIVTGTFESLRLLLELPNTIQDLSKDTSSALGDTSGGLPSWFTGMIMAIISIVVVLAIIYAVAKVKI